MGWFCRTAETLQNSKASNHGKETSDTVSIVHLVQAHKRITLRNPVR